MIFLAPLFLVATAAVAAGVIALHLLALRRPPPVMLPTARFVPDVPARAAARALRPRDPWLLALRLLAVLAIGLAFARPVVRPDRAPVRQVIVADRSRAVESMEELRDSVQARLQPGDVVLALDSAITPLVTTDSLPPLERVEARASLSAALVAARRAATALRDAADSVRIVVVSPLADEAFDASTWAIRAGWAGRVHLVPVAARTEVLTPSGVDVRAPADDLLAIAVARSGLQAQGAVRLLRAAPSAQDSAWASDGGGVLLVWPDDAPPGWRARDMVDTLGAVLAHNATLVAPLPRRVLAPAGEARAWWVDGEPAAIEQPLGAGCLRTVGIPLDRSGDLALRVSFARLLQALALPCGGARAIAPVHDSVTTAFAGAGALPGAVGQAPPRLERAPLVPWLLALGVLLLLLELALRGRASSSPREVAA